MIKISILPVLSDNYAYILKAEDGDIAIIDPGGAAPAIDFLERNALVPRIIFNTHHHGDHTGGNAPLIARYGCTLAVPAKESGRIAGGNIMLTDGMRQSFGGEALHVFETPGHTSGHVCLHFPDSRALFTGDTLFSMGCGRLFEGTAEQMWASLQKIKALPENTLIYCGHEYTLDNAKFGLRIEPENADILARLHEVEILRATGKPSLPISLAQEKKTNIFLRAQTPERFAELRILKDRG
ncbi:MAG: hydroxyacylglutathione hydrolase [Alphaproteobacteria bacterium]|nr:hydroxyacylglutathione hydrolase [Alphaproteobacteria bacterium]